MRLGCGDGNCLVDGKATGQHTNGGCQCRREVRREGLERWAKVAEDRLELLEAAEAGGCTPIASIGTLRR